MASSPPTPASHAQSVTPLGEVGVGLSSPELCAAPGFCLCNVCLPEPDEAAKLREFEALIAAAVAGPFARRTRY